MSVVSEDGCVFSIIFDECVLKNKHCHTLSLNIIKKQRQYLNFFLMCIIRVMINNSILESRF